MENQISENQNPQDHKSFLVSKKGTHGFYTILIVVIGAIAAIVVIFASLHAKLDQDGENAGVFLDLQNGKSQLVLVAAPDTRAVGEVFTVSVILSTEELGVTGADVKLSYDPALLQLEAADSSAQDETKKYVLSEESVFQTVLGFVKDEQKGEVAFSAIQNPGQRLETGGVVGAVKFKALKKGTTSVNFVFTPGATTDTNLASHAAQDILERTEGVQLTIE